MDETICFMSGNSRQAKGRESCCIQLPATQAIPDCAEQPKQGSSGQEGLPAVSGNEDRAHSPQQVWNRAPE